MSTASLRLAILNALAGVRPYALPQPQLFDEVNRRVRPPIALPALVKELSWLKARDHVGFLADALEPDNADARRWLIKEAGLAALQQ